MIGPYSPKEVRILFQEAFNRADLEAIASLYELGAILMVDGEPIVGRERIKDAFGSLVGAGIRMSVKTLIVMESQDGLALLHGEWTVNREPTMGPASSTRGISAEVVRRQGDGTWRFIIDNPYAPSFTDNLAAPTISVAICS